jgi:polyisoprenoid-binding protein YceI
MKRFRLPLLTAAVLSLAFSVPSSAAWELDPAHTGIHFKVRHLMVSSVRGDFGKFSGKVEYDEKAPLKSTAEIRIDAASIDTRIEKRDEHLKSPDFLDVAKFPTITFKSTGVRKAKGGGLAMSGDLTIRGVTKPVVLKIDGPSKAAKGLDGNLHVGGTATAKINRKDFGLTWNKTLETGGVLVGDEIEVTIDLELVEAAGKTAAIP